MDASHDPQAPAGPNLGLSAPPASPDSQAEPALPTPLTLPAAEPLVVLSPAQRQAWDRLNQPDATVTDAAAFAGVSRTQFYRWVDTDPAFRALYTAWQQQQQRAGEGLLFAGEAVSVEVIFQAARDRRDLSAAKFIVKQALAHRQWQQRVHEQRERAQERAFERAQRRDDRAREQTLRREERARERAQRREERAREQAQRGRTRRE